MDSRTFFWPVCAALLGLGSASPMPTPPAITARALAAVPTATQDIWRRQQKPFSISDAIATAVDTKFYSVSGSETTFVGPDSRALSSKSITVTTGGGTLRRETAVQVALHTGKPDGQEEISFFFSPDLADQIQKIVYDGTKTTEEIPDGLAKRGLPIPPPASIIRGLINLVGPELAVGFLSEFTAVAGLGELAALGATAVGFAPLVGAAITIGGTAYAAVELLEYASDHFMKFRALDRNSGKSFPKAIKINKADLKSKQDRCPKEIQCVDCNGVNQVCTSNNAGCLCKNKKECPKKDGSKNTKLPIDCKDSQCKGNDQNLCTASKNKSCPCARYGAGDINQSPKDYAAAFQHLADIFDHGLPPVSTPTSSAPQPTATSGGGTSNPSQCQNDVQGVIDNLNKNFGDTIDINAEQSKFVDFVRGGSNPGNSDWWRLTSSGNAFLVLGKDAERRGFSDAVPPIQKSQLIDFVNQRKLFFCINANPKLVATPATGGRDSHGQALGNVQVCLADSDNYQKCTGSVAPPS